MSERKKVTATATIEQFLIPSKIGSKHKTIHEWLTSICLGKMPDKIIFEYNIRLISGESSKEHKVCFYGVNIKLDNLLNTYTYIDFQPTDLWFKFPKVKYEKFTYKQMQEELTSQVKEFTLTELFQNSFLSKANIRATFSPHPIWIKK